MPEAELCEWLIRMIPMFIVLFIVIAAILYGIVFLACAIYRIWRERHPKKELPRYLRRMY